MDKNILAIDIGGSKIIVGTVDLCGNIQSFEKMELPQDYDVDFVIEAILKMSDKYSGNNIIASGVSIPGLADSSKGIWKYSPFSKITDVPIAQILSEKLGCSVFIENDVNACAIGEKIYGICKEETDFLWMTVSNGIGGALYINNSLYIGQDGYAGEVGHIAVEENTNFVCGCGNIGCLEAMASGKGIEKAYYNLCNKKLSAKEIADLANLGEKEAIEVYKNAGGYIGKAITHVVNTLNIRKVVLGGGVCQSFDLLKPHIEASLKKHLFSFANKNLSIEKTGLGYYASLLGAAALAAEKMRVN